MFSLGIALISRLRFRHKFQLLLTLLLLPLVFASVVIYNLGRVELRHLEARARGFVVAEALHELRVLGAKHRGTAAQWLNGVDEAGEKLVELEGQMQEAMSYARTVMDRKKMNEEVRAAFVEANNTWTLLLKPRLKTLGAETSFVLHTTWVGEVSAVIDLVVNSTDVVLDDRIDTYFYGQLSVYHIANLQEFTGQLRGFGAGFAASQQTSMQMLLELNNLYDRLQDLLEIVQNQLSFIEDIDQEGYQKLTGSVSEFETQLQEFLNITEKKLLDTSTIDIKPSDYFNAGTRAISAMSKLLHQVNKNYKGRVDFYTRKTNRSRIFVFTLFGFQVAIGMYLFTCVRLNLNSNISKVQEMARGLSQGEIANTYTAGSTDELGGVVNELNSSFKGLRDIIAIIKSQSLEQTKTAQTLTELASESNSLGQSQQNQIINILSAARQISDSGRQVAKLCQQATKETGIAEDNANQGVKRSSTSATQIRQLAEGIRQAGTDIDELAQQAAQIGTVIDVIKSVAEQTNLLALNAAIEAARAGEQGRGFAVVADEVRTLATRTQDSTNEIEATIAQLQQVAQKAVSTMNDAVEQASSGEKAAEETGEALSQIQAVIEAVTGVIQQVDHASQEQSSSLDGISENVEQVESAASQLVGHSEGVTSTAKSLTEQARQMDEVVMKFKV